MSIKSNHYLRSPNNKTRADKSNHNNHANYQVFILTLFFAQTATEKMFLISHLIIHLLPPQKEPLSFFRAAQSAGSHLFVDRGSLPCSKFSHSVFGHIAYTYSQFYCFFSISWFGMYTYLHFYGIDREGIEKAKSHVLDRLHALKYSFIDHPFIAYAKGLAPYNPAGNVHGSVK